jgi:hypothetical protein
MPMLASMIHLWATIRGKSFPVTNSLIDDEEHLLFSCENTKDIRVRFAGLPMSSLRDLMHCEDIGSVAWFVHECMERVENTHTG